MTDGFKGMVGENGNLISVYTVILNYSNDTMNERLTHDASITQNNLNKDVSSANIIVLVNVILLAVLPAIMISGSSQDLKEKASVFKL
ncbi:hypothetical protein [Paenibacillus sp. LHD-38]|uniref:hypothetical protein n=1 Tax=Paenibacillus sp. LHD-38 TaxID=3072143 RepID=UPI00280C6AD6|nr:hypothetical protein [Paenibacillus sp. LHD-38]MDQ8736817.1 hypothetical protein [Paenibacillus sp. LHD-38]